MSMRKANAGSSYAPKKSAELLKREAAARQSAGSARADGRELAALRAVYMKPGVVSRAVGSAYFEANNTKIICSVYGPRPSQRRMEFSDEGTIQCDVKFAPFSRAGSRPTDGQSVEEKELSLSVLRAIEASIMKDKFPKSVLDVYVVVIAACGSVTAACINCAALALVDAGIELFDIVAAASVIGYGEALPGDSDRRQLRVDPIAEEEEDPTTTACVTVAQMPSLGEVTLLHQTGKMRPAELLDTMRMALDATALVHKMMVRSVTDGATPQQDAGSSDDDMEESLSSDE